MVLEFNPSRFPDSLLKRGFVGQIAYFFFMLVLAMVIIFLIGRFVFSIDFVKIVAGAVIVAIVVTRSGIDKLRKNDLGSP